MIDKIVALDPAGPLFIRAEPNERLGSTSARFVQVIHTNPGGAGIEMSLGHVDFYINGKRTLQPGCPENNFLREFVNVSIIAKITSFTNF